MLNPKTILTDIVLHPAYFGPIDQFVAMANANTVVFENEGNYQKQTYRNRQYIYGANGKLSLNIPVKHQSSAGIKDTKRRQLYKEVKIENEFHWQRDHWRSIQTAYRTSPFFEFYEDDFAPLYEKPAQFLLDFNYRCLDLVLDCLSLNTNYSKTTEFIAEPKELTDLRGLVLAKRNHSENKINYHQVFEEKHGFIENLSILDLLFNEGPNALQLLSEQ